MARIDFIHVDPQIMSGTSVFRGTRVPVKTLFDYLEEGDTIDSFLDDFRTVKREQAIGVLEVAKWASLLPGTALKFHKQQLP